MARTSDQDDAGPLVTSLTALREAENTCRRCPLYKNATQAVPDEGPRRAALMLVGEQLATRKIWPASRLSVRPVGCSTARWKKRKFRDAKPSSPTRSSSQALQARDARQAAPAQAPNAYEIDRCCWWLTQERAIVRPQAIVALGATAARSLFGRRVAIGKSRGHELTTKDGVVVFVTIHPSMLLRIGEQPDREREYRAVVGVLRRAAAYLRKHKAAA